MPSAKLEKIYTHKQQLRQRERHTHAHPHKHTLLSIAITSFASVGKLPRINRLRVCRFKATNATWILSRTSFHMTVPIGTEAIRNVLVYFSVCVWESIRCLCVGKKSIKLTVNDSDINANVLMELMLPRSKWYG